MKNLLLVLLMSLVFINFAVSQSIYGIDVSASQNPINWTQVLNSGKSFAWIKATEGSNYISSTFTTHTSNASATSIVTGVYHFARPDLNNSAVTEANHFINTASAYIGNNHLPPALDIEDPAYTTYINANSISALATWLSTWINTVKNATGVTPVLYTTRCIAATLYPYYSNGTIVAKLWIADWPKTAGFPTNTTNCIWSSWPWLFHQYSTTGSVSGISQQTDLDVFNGGLSDFNTLIGASGASCTDNFESNDTYTSATNVFAQPLNSSGSNYTPVGTNIGFAGDVDWFKVNIGACGTLTLNLSNLPLDYDIELYGPNGTAQWINGNYNTGTNNETITYNFTGSSTTVYVKVYGKQSSSYTTSSCYNLQFLWTPCSSSIDLTKQTDNMNFSGNQYTVSTTLINNGSAPASSFEVGFYLSSSSTFNTLDYLIGTKNVNGLNAGGTTSLSFSVDLCSIGIPNGTYYIGYYIDKNSIVNESDETNNIWFWPNYPISLNCPTCTPPSTPIISGNNSICMGNANPLGISNYDASCTYSWSTPTGVINSTSVSGTNTGTYTVTATNNCGSAVSSGFFVTVNSPPNISASANPSSITSGASSTLTASGANTYLWSTGSSNSIITVNPTQTTTYTVTGTSNGCSATAQVTVNVTSPTCPSNATLTVSNPPINPLNSSGASGTTNVTVSSQLCSWSATSNAAWLTLSPTSGTGNGSFTWNASACTGSNNPRTAIITLYINGVQSQTINVTQNCTQTTNCTNPPTANAGQNATYTAGMQIGGNPTAANGPAPYTYAWSPATGLSSATVSNPTVNGITATTTYTVIVTDAAGCTASNSITISVNGGTCPNPLPTPQLQINGCNLSITPVANVIYQWYYNNNPIPSTNSNQIFAQNGNGQYYVMITSLLNNNCTAQSIPISINCPTGIIDEVFSKLVVYPNPTHSILNIDLNEKLKDKAKVEVFTALGQLMYQQNLETKNIISVENWSVGVYFIKVTVGDKSTVVRFLKE